MKAYTKTSSHVHSHKEKIKVSTYKTKLYAHFEEGVKDSSFYSNNSHGFIGIYVYLIISPRFRTTTRCDVANSYKKYIKLSS